MVVTVVCEIPPRPARVRGGEGRACGLILPSASPLTVPAPVAHLPAFVPLAGAAGVHHHV